MITATASVEVSCDPRKAFDVFTNQIGRWWRRGTYYWMDPERAQEMRFADGRLVEVYNLTTGEEAEIGRVLNWEPGELLVFTWRMPDWPAGADTTVAVRFAASPTGCLVSIEHTGWEAVPDGAARGTGYGNGWAELLGFYRDAI
jgi:uncharacterized protein YndB with AHSA1/START domain